MIFILFVITVCLNLAKVDCRTDGVLTIHSQNAPLFVTSENFFSVTLDTSVIAEHFLNFNMSNKRLIHMVEVLNPTYLRIGGNMADRLHFSTKQIAKERENITVEVDGECAYEELDNCGQDFPNFTMTGEEWTKINHFAQTVGTKILFDLNCLIRNSDGSWNTENAEELIDFSNNHKFEIDWQLGNEPNAFKHVFNYEVNATQLARDFVVLRNILNKFPRYKKALLVGPDVTRPRPENRSSEKYLQKFLENIDNDILNAVAFHQYYLNGRTATLNDFINPEVLDLLESQIEIVHQIAKRANFANKPVWLTETSSAYGGGAPGLSNTFAGSFMWVDKLGVAAKYSVQKVFRQSLFKNNYALIDDDYQPTPDWWLSILYNRIVGPEVLDCEIVAPPTVRLYCHCSKLVLYKTPLVVVFGSNLANKTMEINLGSNLATDMHLDFILTPQNMNLTSRNVLLNGKLLKLQKNGKLPLSEKSPKVVTKSTVINIPPFSIGFWVMPILKGNHCSKPNISFS